MNSATTPPSDAAPRITNWLGWGGVLPFILCAVATQSSNATLVLYGFVGGTSYAAVILTFLGAVHWGLAMTDTRNAGWYVWSITPSLLAWASLLIFEVDLRLFALIPLFGLAWGVDRIAARDGLVPAWYMPLRTKLTIGAVASLLLMLV